MLLSLEYLSFFVFFFRFKIDSFLLSDKRFLMYSSNFWAPFIFWEIGLVVGIFSRISFSDKWVGIYFFKYNANWVGKFSMFSGFISNLQYIDTAISSALSDCFFYHYLTESVNPSGVINMVSSLARIRLNLNWIRGFTYLDLWFNRVLCWNVGVSTKNTRKHLRLLFELSLSCIWGYREKEREREIFSHSDTEVPLEYF